MGNMKSRRDLEARSIAEQAAEWLLILEAATDEDRAQFADWLRQSPSHVEAFLRASAVDSLLSEVDRARSIELDKGPFEEVADISPEQSEQPPSSLDGVIGTVPPAALPRRATGRRWSRRQRLIWGTAASVLLAVIAGLGVKSARTNDWTHYSAAIGEQRTLQLPDGSVMFLSPGSSVDVLLLPGERRLRLTSGGAMFRVYHDKTRPFRVHSGGAVVEAVGTQFNVNLVRGESVVSVVEGIVQVSHEPSMVEKVKQTFVRSGSADVKSVRLAAGQETRVADDGQVAVPKVAAVDPVTDWKARRLTFINETLFAIADEFNRYNPTPKIRIDGSTAGKLRYAAAFDADDPESLVTVLEMDPRLAIERQGENIVIRSK